MLLKPHDTVLALKYGTVAKACAEKNYSVYADSPSGGTSVRWMSEMLLISPGEVTKSLKRLIAAQLVAENTRDNLRSDFQLNYHLVTRNMNEWLAYGIRYWVQPDPVGVVRGMSTSWSCPEIRSEMSKLDIPLVWPSGDGKDRGEGIQPLYMGVPAAAKRDPILYKLLALIDIMRLGKPRELSIGKDILKQTLDEINDAQRQL